jgi:hypothetical protein
MNKRFCCRHNWFQPISLRQQNTATVADSLLSMLQVDFACISTGVGCCQFLTTSIKAWSSFILFLFYVLLYPMAFYRTVQYQEISPLSLKKPPIA